MVLSIIPICFILFINCYIYVERISHNIKHGVYIMKTRIKHRHRRAANKTRRRHQIAISGCIYNRKQGWICVEIRGQAYERGFAHGYLLYKQLARLFECLPFKVKEDFKKTYEEYLEFSKEFISPVVRAKYPEFYNEIRGISDGAAKKGVKFPIEDLIAWNAYMTLYSYFVDGGSEKIDKCSAFIATGSSTKNGEIIMAHNTHCSFVDGQFFNIILRVIPDKNVSFKMQTAAGLISSTTDWFVTDAGIFGCETTIGGIKHKPRLMESPYFCRIREAMQYGHSIDDYFSIMKTDNAGDYSGSWLFGDIHTGEIARLELGVNKHVEERTKNGFYVGMNSPMNTALRINETDDLQHNNAKYSVGSRYIRLQQLLDCGNVTIESARKIISDHYDVYENRENPSIHTICKHPEIDGSGIEKPYAPKGAVDGKVISSRGSGTFYGRFGSSCGRAFSAKRHLKKHPEYKHYEGYIVDFPSYKWTTL